MTGILRNLSMTILVVFGSTLGMAEPYASINGWTVNRNTGNCSIATSYELNTTMYISYDISIDAAYLFISDPKLASIEDGKKYSLKVYFMTSGHLDDGWGETDFTGVVFEDGQKSLMRKFDGSDFVTDIAKSDTIALFRDDILVESLTLKGSGAAVAKLIECAREEYRRNPSDPLRGAGK